MVGATVKDGGCKIIISKDGARKKTRLGEFCDFTKFEKILNSMHICKPILTTVHYNVQTRAGPREM